MESSNPPPAPNPNQLAKTQEKANAKTALTNFRMSLVDQRTPFGALNFEKGPDGRYRAVTSLSPEQQKILDDYEAMSGNYSDFFSGYDPSVDLSQTRIDSEILDSYRPEYQKNYDELRRKRMVELANKGLKEGSTGFIEGMRDFDLNQGDVWSRLQRDARQQALQQMITERNLPFQEAAWAKSMIQPGAYPSFVGTPVYNQPFTDYAGIAQQGYQNQLEAWKQEEATRNAMMSGLFQLGGTIAGGVVGGPIGASIGGRLGGAVGGGGWVGPGGTGPGLTFPRY